VVRSFYPALVLGGHENAVYALCDVGDGLVVSASLDTTLRVWNLATGECVRHLTAHKDGAAHVGGILCLTRMRDGESSLYINSC
jgi:WD40 repeat protein